MIRIRVFDTETTGLRPHDKVIECGYHDLVNDGDGWRVDRICSAVFNTIAIGVRCADDARRIHKIQDDEIERGWPYEMLDKFISYLEPDVYAAHNLAFDAKFFKFDKPQICTLKAARKLWPHAPSHKNGHLGVWKGLTIDAELHRVIPDTQITAGLLKLMLTEDKQAPEDLVRMSGWKAANPGVVINKPMILQFGEHKGKSLNAVPTHYLKWIVNDSACRDDVKDAAAKELEKR
jgi:exodeoxyribonuclease X